MLSNSSEFSTTVWAALKLGPRKKLLKNIEQFRVDPIEYEPLLVTENLLLII